MRVLSCPRTCSCGPNAFLWQSTQIVVRNLPVRLCCSAERWLDLERGFSVGIATCSCTRAVRTSSTATASEASTTSSSTRCRNAHSSTPRWSTSLRCGPVIFRIFCEITLFMAIMRRPEHVWSEHRSSERLLHFWNSTSTLEFWMLACYHCAISPRCHVVMATPTPQLVPETVLGDVSIWRIDDMTDVTTNGTTNFFVHVVRPKSLAGG